LAGAPNGDSAVDNCGECVAPGSECVQDCNGEWGGSAFVDNCDACVASSDEACTVDCNGDFGGDALEDNCGTCDNDPLNDCAQDCAGTWGGDALNDNCGTCDSDSSNDCAQDCAGDWGGDATVDNCGTCDSDSSNDCAQDCAGDWGGSATVDNCGTCDSDSDNDCAQDCSGDWGGSATEDGCGICDSDNDNDNVTCTGCMDPSASNFDPFATIPGACDYAAFSYNQSMSQAFYFFSGCSINGDPCVEGEDGIYAFTSDGVCTGGGNWGGTTIEIPVMGSDATNYTSGCSIQAYTDEDECDVGGGVWGDYLASGDIPNFRIVDGSTGAVYDAVLNSLQGAFGDCSGYPNSDCETFPGFQNLSVFWDLGTADAIRDCDDTLGGHAYIDDCSDCSGGSTGLGHNHNDPDSDTVCK
jgi:hypothetical protein